MMHPFRFVDRDMLMRYQWGLGVGHLYAHNSYPPNEWDVQCGDNLGHSGAATTTQPGEIEDPANIMNQPAVGFLRMEETHSATPDSDGDHNALDEDSELGEDDMVYPNDSDCSMTEDGMSANEDNAGSDVADED